MHLLYLMHHCLIEPHRLNHLIEKVQVKRQEGKGWLLVPVYKGLGWKKERPFLVISSNKETGMWHSLCLIGFPSLGLAIISRQCQKEIHSIQYLCMKPIQVVVYSMNGFYKLYAGSQPSIDLQHVEVGANSHIAYTGREWTATSIYTEYIVSCRR